MSATPHAGGEEASDEQPTNDEQLVDVGEATPEELMDACSSLGQVKALDGEIVDRTDTDDGRVRERYLRAISEPEDIVRIEEGDQIITKDGRRSSIQCIGSDVSDSSGMHIYEQREHGGSPLHLRLLQRWLGKSNLVVIGVRTRTYKERLVAGD